MLESKADIPYIPDRIGLLPFEDRVLSAYLRVVPDYYTHPNDQSTFGKILRAFAKEQARAEYSYQASMLAHSQRFQSPPDLKRNYAAQLQVDRRYPYEGVSDSEYRGMIIQLLEAYQKGASLEGIKGVVAAYTSYPAVVEESYKRMREGLADPSDRNALSVSIKLPLA